MSNKKLLNSIDSCVDDCLYGLSVSHPQLQLHAEQRVLFDGTYNEKKKVAVISGGGSGHEPFSAGYVGPGMLTASISGSVFASPPSHNIIHAIRATAANHEGGVFVIIPNYTGDVLNFGLAVEVAKREGIKVDSIVVGEDIALESYNVQSRAGRRGLVGLVVIFKIAGYLAAKGENLEAIKDASEKALKSIASIGLSLSSCSLPGGKPLFHLDEDEIGLGVGVHGEAGVQRMKIESCSQIVDLFLKHLTESLKITKGHYVAVFVNNLGALSNLEQWIVAGEVKKQLINKQIRVERVHVGPMFTSINMAGVQVCILKLSELTMSTFLKALDYETEVPGWPGCRTNIPQDIEVIYKREPPEAVQVLKGYSLGKEETKFMRKCVSRVANSIVENEKKLNLLDSGCGDGDCGTTLRHLAQEIKHQNETAELNCEYPVNLFGQIAVIAQEAMGGTSGAIYSLIFTSAACELESHKNLNDPHTWAKVWRASLRNVQKYSVARVGDRTMFDSLEPACDEFERYLQRDSVNAAQALASAVQVAKKGCESTRTMKAMAGRASYVEDSQIKDVDAGAYAIAVSLAALLEAFTE